ncbi:hypothetical protein FRB90_002560 [Tulasnella sp. 427]|nr:hypothetical protein FRB90_002560 [Tulasnella sp. 427]
MQLSLQDVALPWNHPRLADLRVLDLDYEPEYIPLPRDLHRILSSSPSLEELHLGKTRSSPDTVVLELTDHIEEYPGVVLRHVQRVYIRDVGSALVTLLLKVLNCPACTEVKAYPCRGEGLSDFVLHIAANAIKLLPELRVNTSTADGVVRMTGGSLRTGMEEGECQVDLTLLDIDMDKFVRFVEDLRGEDKLVYRQL